MGVLSERSHLHVPGELVLWAGSDREGLTGGEKGFWGGVGRGMLTSLL